MNDHILQILLFSVSFIVVYVACGDVSIYLYVLCLEHYFIFYPYYAKGRIIKKEV